MTSGKHRNYISLIVFIIVSAGLALYEPLIFSADNLFNISKQAALIAIFAMAQAVVLITKGLDLSQGGTITVVSVSIALLSNEIGIAPAILVGLLLGMLVGLVNGLLVAGLKISPFVVTLGIGFLLQGVALVLANGQPVYEVHKGFDFLGWAVIFKLPLIVYILIILALAMNFYLAKIIYGRYLYAIGSNENAARLTGVSVRKHKVIAYALCSVITAVGAAFLASRINSGHPVEGSNTALQSVAACVIGGVSLFGGKGTVQGVLLGSLLLAFISNALNILNVSSYYQQIMVGLIIIFAVIIDKIQNRNSYEE